MQRIRLHFAVVLVAASAVIGLAGCSSPSASARACSARTQLEASLSKLRGFDYTNPNAADLAGILNSMANELKGAEAAVPLPQNSRLRDLGGAGYLRTLNGDLAQSAQQLQIAHSTGNEITVFELRPTVTRQGGQVQQVADAISGC